MAERSFDHGIREQGCSGECAHCAVHLELEDAPYRGGRFVLASFSTFLLPLILGCIGAAVLGQTAAKSLLGGVGGLVLGALLGAAFLHRIKTNSG